MVECATFADDIKYKGGAYQKNWHFVNTPFVSDGGELSDYEFKMDEFNVTEAIDGIVGWFNKEEGYESNTAVKGI